MITCIVYDSVTEELECLRRVLSMEAAKLTADEWNIEYYGKRDSLREALTEKANLDIVCIDITAANMLRLVKTVRTVYKDMKLLLIADTSISPMQYLRPGIRPDALMLRPADEPEIRAVLHELLEAYMEQVYQPGTENSFTVETRDGKTFLLYSTIAYFESRNKKIYVRAGRWEYGFYETMEHLEQRLPEDFIRCHRSFIVNRSKIKKVLLSQGYIELVNGDQIPISRTYRTGVKGL